MIIDCRQRTPEQMYFLLTQAVIPRPIAWVLSDHGNGAYNLAPFSFFNAVASNPPVLMISVGWKDDTARKDTWVNIEQRSNFVIHIPPRDLARPMVDTSAALPHGISEAERFDLKLEPVEGWPLPRAAGAPAAFLCRKYAIYEIGRDPQGMILGEVTSIWLEEKVVSMSGSRMILDPRRMNPVARLGGTAYADLGEIFSMARPE